MIVAVEEGRIVGFAHAGFGPAADQKSINTRVGSTLLVIVPPHPSENEIRDQLLGRCEMYLRESGATCLLGGGNDSFRGFYLGLYGGSDCTPRHSRFLACNATSLSSCGLSEARKNHDSSAAP